MQINTENILIYVRYILLIFAAFIISKSYIGPVEVINGPIDPNVWWLLAL